MQVEPPEEQFIFSRKGYCLSSQDGNAVDDMNALRREVSSGPSKMADPSSQAKPSNPSKDPGLVGWNMSSDVKGVK